MKKERKLIGDYGSGNTFTIYKGKDNSGNDTIRIGATDDSTTGLALLLIPIIVFGLIIYLVYKLVLYLKEKKAEEKRIKEYEERFYKTHTKRSNLYEKQKNIR